MAILVGRIAELIDLIILQYVLQVVHRLFLAYFT
jgi:hypothetical protein